MDLPEATRAPTYEELTKAYDDAVAERHKVEKDFDEFHKNDAEFPFYEVFAEAMKPYNKKIHLARIALIPLMTDFELSSMEESCGDYMTLSVFRSAVAAGAFIDYDGYGNLCIGEQVTDIEIYPSEVRDGADLSRFDGVMWHNR